MQSCLWIPSGWRVSWQEKTVSVESATFSGPGEDSKTL